MARFAIGIDLGTTNSALCYLDLARHTPGGRIDVKHFLVPQTVAVGEVKDRSLLPSFLYLPGAHDMPAGAAALPWDAQRSYVVGDFARSHGGKVPGRLVSSAKSWLCHDRVDRSAALLPWSAPPDVARISPVEASARYLRHLVESWNHVMAANREDFRLEKQEVVLTVPASFDDVARNLTVEAARKAGLENVVLIEEPQAAFYCWLVTHSAREAAALKPGSRRLVIDVGGGTSDFSLIEATEQKGELGFVRQAVGDHLLLGGDNMDLALAKFIETKLPGTGRLDAVQYGLLTQACRAAKEVLLGPTPPDRHPVTVVGRGRAVIGGTLSTHLTPAEVQKVIFDGFFPLTPADAEPQRGARVGLHEMGLPYVSDPAVTRHLAYFLKQQGVGAASRAAPESPPIGSSVEGASGPARLAGPTVGAASRAAPEAPPKERSVGGASGAASRAAPEAPATDRSVAGASGPARLAGPTALLFNGGVFQPASLRQRLLEVLHGWYDRPGQPWEPLVLTNPSLDLAVAWGAAYYAFLRHTGGKRIGGGIARSYYIGIDAAAPDPEQTGSLSVVCVVPQHLEEGQEVVLDKPELELALGQPVQFPLYTSTVRGEDKPGEVLHLQPEQLLQLPPLHTVLRGGKRSGTRRVPVTLAAVSTAIGTLELYCAARDGNNRWRLEFNIRDLVQPAAREDSTASDEPTLTDVWPEHQVLEARRLIRQVFGDAETPEGVAPAELTRALEAALEAPRSDWPSGLCRRLWEFLAETADGRRRSPAHQSRWFHLVGWCLRPGFGDPLDRFRVEQLWKLLTAPPRAEPGKPAPARQPEGGADYWIMWRRVAGGLTTQQQQALHDRLRPMLLPGKGKAISKPNLNELAEMWRAVASFERLDGKHKEALGTTLLKPLRRSPVPTYGFWSLTRLGARALLYGPLNTVVHPQVVQTWLDALLAFQPGNDSERLGWAFCLAQLARRTGQRALDVDDSRRASVLTVLKSLRIPGHWIKMVEEISDLEREEQGQMLGDSLPIGLRLAAPQ